MDLSFYIIVLVLIATLTYWFLTKTHKYWDNQNVPCIPNPIPGLGHLWPVITLKENIGIFALRAYRQTGASMIGFYFLRRPGIFIRDPELVKNVLLSDFTSFHRNFRTLNEKSDPVMIKNPFFATDYHEWKASRSRSISHLTGKKLTNLFVIAEQVCSKFSGFVDRKIREDGTYYECELKELFTRYTGEIVANSAFAIEGRSFDDDPHELSFKKMSRAAFAPSLMSGVKNALILYLPSVANFFNISFLQKSTETYFRETLKAIIKQRKESNSAPNDYLQYCLDTDGEDKMEEIIADVIIFHIDVYETSSTTMAVMFYYLSQNIEVQEKIRSYVIAKLKENEGKVSYEFLKTLNYLEQVIFESLRILAPLGAQMKMCTKEITLTGNDGLKCNLKPGDPVIISVYGLHQDAKYWPNPDVFDPERFSPENQANRNKFAFLGFGEGPRKCIGMRLAMMNIKLMMVEFLTKFKVSHSPRTKVPIELDSSSILTYIKGGFWARFENLK